MRQKALDLQEEDLVYEVEDTRPTGRRLALWGRRHSPTGRRLGLWGRRHSTERKKTWFMRQKTLDWEEEDLVYEAEGTRPTGRRLGLWGRRHSTERKKTWFMRQKTACLGGAVGSITVRAAWLWWSVSLGLRPSLARSLCQVIVAYALRLNSQAGTEGSTVSSLICDRWLILGLETLSISRCLNHW